MAGVRSTVDAGDLPYHALGSGKFTVSDELEHPKRGAFPHAVAARQPNGSLVTLPYEQKPGADWTQIVFQATTPEIQLEYYDPSLMKNGDSWSYLYTWLGEYSVKSFKIEVQLPAGASNMQIKPGMVTARQGNDGLNYYIMNVGPLSEGQLFEISLEYQKTSDELSFSEMPVEPSSSLSGETAGTASMTNVLPWVLGILGIGLIAGGGLWYWQSGRQKNQPVSVDRSHRRKPTKAEADEGDGNSQIYCHQCGKRASSGDRFCRACGTPLRVH